MARPGLTSTMPRRSNGTGARISICLYRFAGAEVASHPGARRRVSLSGRFFARPGYREGSFGFAVRKRHPIALVIEWAGCAATTGAEFWNSAAKTPHQRVPRSWAPRSPCATSPPSTTASSRCSPYDARCLRGAGLFLCEAMAMSRAHPIISSRFVGRRHDVGENDFRATSPRERSLPLISKAMLPILQRPAICARICGEGRDGKRTSAISFHKPPVRKAEKCFATTSNPARNDASLRSRQEEASCTAPIRAPKKKTSPVGPSAVNSDLLFL